MDSLLQNTDSIKNNRDILDEYHLRAQNYFVIIIYRSINSESFQNFENILLAIKESSKQFIHPIHSWTENFIVIYYLSTLLNKMNIIEIIRLLGHLNFLRILQGAKIALTDSRVIQKQAFMLGVHCITLRENTEWIETVEMGWNVLVGADKEKIKKMIECFSPEGERYGVYGDGKASNKVAEILTSFAGKKKGGQIQG